MIDPACASVNARQGRTCLYRHFNADSILLYAGIAGNPFTRLGGHRRAALWFEQVARIDVEWYGSRTAAKAAETKAVRTERPLFNFTGRGGAKLLLHNRAELRAFAKASCGGKSRKVELDLAGMLPDLKGEVWRVDGKYEERISTDAVRKVLGLTRSEVDRIGRWTIVKAMRALGWIDARKLHCHKQGETGRQTAGYFRPVPK
jgi:hypothetical protein